MKPQIRLFLYFKLSNNEEIKLCVAIVDPTLKKAVETTNQYRAQIFDRVFGRTDSSSSHTCSRRGVFKYSMTLKAYLTVLRRQITSQIYTIHPNRPVYYVHV